MEILLIEPDKITRDHIKVGLQSFQDINVEAAEGFSAVNRARQKTFDYIFIGHQPGIYDGLTDLKDLREFDKETDVILVTTQKHVKHLAAEKSQYNIYSTLAQPLDVREFFRLIARMRDRIAGRQTAK